MSAGSISQLPGSSAGATAAVPLLEVCDLVVTFRSNGLFRKKTSNTALKGVSLEVHRGSTVGVVGQSGSGKSTLARTIVGLERARSGTILLNGERLDSTRASVRALRGDIQMVFQDSLNSLNPRRSVRATLSEPLLVHRIVPKNKMVDRVAQLLTDVGLTPDYMHRRPSQLSGGERQRVNIARALASEPSLIIADEPTSSLDVSIRAQILELLITLQAERGLSYIFISHDLHVVRHMSSLVMVMKDGEVVEVADKATLYANPQHEYTKELLAATPTTQAALAHSRARGRSVFPLQA
jgi:ABC-type glutathione transport system ATPase component